MEAFKLQNKVTYSVQTTLLGGWLDVYVNGKLKLTKKFTTVEQLEQLKQVIEATVVTHLISKEV